MRLTAATMKAISAILFMMTIATAADAAVSHANFGRLPDGSPVTVYTLNSAHLVMRIMTFGARVVSIKAPDRNGNMTNVVLGYDNLEDYIKDNKTYFGAVPGRYANRIANGIFRLEGKEYHLSINEGTNTLHGGREGFDRRNWAGKEVADGVEFTLVSQDGDQGFPGRLAARVRYILHGNKVVSLAEDLWIQTEFYKSYIIETNSISEEQLEFLEQAASRNAEIRASAHRLFSRIFETLDEPGTHALIEHLLSIKRPAGKTN
jgi:hypothetical protein